MFAVLIILYVLLTALLAASGWFIFANAGQPGWASLVPFYNMWIFIKMIGKPPSWFVFLLIPFVNIVIAILLIFELARVYGKSAGYAVGMLLLPTVFYPMLAFGDARYLGPDAGQSRRSKRRASRYDDDEDDDDEDDRPRRRRDEDDDDRDRPRKRRN